MAVMKPDNHISWMSSFQLHRDIRAYIEIAKVRATMKYTRLSVIHNKYYAPMKILK